jgi:hypothetical protein
MRIALINSNRKNQKAKIYPPVSLLKIGAWLKSEGNKCELLDNTLPTKKQKFDEIWITTLFTYDIYYVKAMINSAKKICDKIRVGGISASLFPDFFKMLDVEVHVGLHPKAENFAPDYSLLGYKPEFSIAYTSRGCIRKCEFCMVKNLEPEFRHRDWEKDLSSDTTKVQFYDNNWLAKDMKDWTKDVEKLRRLVEEKRITEIDFNQSLDCRILTEEQAKMMQGLPIRPMRFAFDGMQEDKYYQKSVRLTNKYGFRNYRSNYLYNFNDTPEDLYYRLRENVKLSAELKCDVKAFPMKFQPIMQLDSKKKYVGKNWSRVMLSGFKEILKSHSPNQCVAARSFKEFEYWFGKDKDEFIKLINYPKIAKLCGKKKEYLQKNRYKLIGRGFS